MSTCWLLCLMELHCHIEFVCKVYILTMLWFVQLKYFSSLPFHTGLDSHDGTDHHHAYICLLWYCSALVLRGLGGLKWLWCRTMTQLREFIPHESFIGIRLHCKQYRTESLNRASTTDTTEKSQGWCLHMQIFMWS